MGITPDEFAEHFPKLYHMAEAGAWPSIKRHGLLSVSALLDLFEIVGEKREKIESCHRPTTVTIEHPRMGAAVIRDQIPLPEDRLRRALVGMVPADWYRLLNGKAFFWATEDRVSTLLGARAYRDRPHCVLVVDSAALLAKYHKHVSLCPINSGCVIPNPYPRGKDTFLAMSEYPFEEWRLKRGSPKKAIAELTVPYSVPDILQMTLMVELRKDGRIIEQLS